MVVVGAGLAGLACALRLRAAGVEVEVLEAAERVGGRVVTDVVDGYRCDVGFQLVNPAYPALGRVLREVGHDLGDLDLRPFGAGVVVATAPARPGGRQRRDVLADPRRRRGAAVSSALSSVRAPVGSVREKAAFARWAVSAGYGDPHRIRDAGARDTTLARSLDAAGVSGRLRRAVVTPFLAGVLGEDAGETSAAFARLVVRSFVRGTPAVPARGVQALPELLAAALPPGSVRLATPVRALDDAALRGADAVVVATDAAAARALLPRLAVPGARALTTFWHAAPEPPSTTDLLHVDGDRRGPVVNSAVVSNIAPGYAPPGGHLVATTVLGDRSAALAATEAEVLAQLEVVYGAPTRGWQLLRAHALPQALPALPPPLDARRPAELGGGVFVAGDHRDTASQQGALASGRRAADAVLLRLAHRT